MSAYHQFPDAKESDSALPSKVVCSDRRSNRSVGKKRKYAEADLKQSLQLVGCSVCKEGEPKYKCPKCRSTYCSIACCRAHKEVCSITNNATGSDNLPDSQSDASLHIVSENPHQKTSQSKYVSSADLKELQLDLKRCFNTFSELRQKVSDDQIDEDLGLGWKMSDEMVAAMKSSSWLRHELSDVGLQQLISKIVATPSHLLPNSRGSAHKQLSPLSCTTLREKMLFDTKHRYPRFQTFLDKLLCLTNVYERRPMMNGSLTPLDEWLVQDSNESSCGFKECELFLAPVHKKARANTSKDLPSSDDETSSSSDTSSE
jgi:HIT zinc finger